MIQAQDVLITCESCGSICTLDFKEDYKLPRGGKGMGFLNAPYVCEYKPVVTLADFEQAIMHLLELKEQTLGLKIAPERRKPSFDFLDKWLGVLNAANRHRLETERSQRHQNKE